MHSFAIYLLKRMPLPEVLREHSELLDAAAMNALFRQQAEEVLPRVQDPKVKEDLMAFLRMKPVAYIDKALRRSGMQDADLDEALQAIVVKFLVTPGNLFRGWNLGQLFTPRFKTAVKNSVITLARKRQKRSKRFQELPHDTAALRRNLSDDPITDFRNWLAVQYGETVAKVFDHRLADRDTKELIGQPGVETSYALKKSVQQIKAGAVIWSRSHPDFLLRVARMMDLEQQTMDKRFGRSPVGAA